jgi:hypothetical protein
MIANRIRTIARAATAAAMICYAAFAEAHQAERTVSAVAPQSQSRPADAPMRLQNEATVTLAADNRARHHRYRYL